MLGRSLYFRAAGRSAEPLSLSAGRRGPPGWIMFSSGVLPELDLIEELRLRRWARENYVPADERETGWTAGEHVLDTDFGLAKNVINDTLHFDLRVDVDRLPADLLRAYTAVELKALTKDNPSGFPSARQKREAKETARERLEAEAR